MNIVVVDGEVEVGILMILDFEVLVYCVYLAFRPDGNRGGFRPMICRDQAVLASDILDGQAGPDAKAT